MRCSGPGSRPLGCGLRREQGSRRVRRSVQERLQGQEAPSASLSRRGRRLRLGLRLGPGVGPGVRASPPPVPDSFPPAGRGGVSGEGLPGAGPSWMAESSPKVGYARDSRASPGARGAPEPPGWAPWGCETEDRAAASGGEPVGTAGRLRASLHLAPSRSSAGSPQDARVRRTRCCAGLLQGERRREKGVGAPAGLGAVGWRGSWLREVCVRLPLRTRSYLELYQQESGEQAGAESSWEQEMKSGSRQTVHHLQV